MKSKRNQRLAKDASIAIVGGGIAGSAAALSLQQAGFTRVKVYERDKGLYNENKQRHGYGMTLTYNPKGPLAKLGVLEELAQLDTPSRSHYTFDHEGYILGYFGNMCFEERGFGQRGNLRIPRQKLRSVLQDKLDPDTIQWGHKLVTFSETNGNGIDSKGSVEMHFEVSEESSVNGNQVKRVKASAKLLVAADGVNSIVASTMYGAADYLGIFVIVGITPIFHPLLDERGFYTLDGEHRLFTMPFGGSAATDALLKGNGSSDSSRQTMWQLSFRLDKGKELDKLSMLSCTALLQEALRRCDGWHEPVTKMLAATPYETVWGTGLRDRTPIDTYAFRKESNYFSRILLLGDAKHAMSPFKGQGANQALADAPLLASKLCQSSFSSAIRNFEREMVGRTRIKVESSRESASLLHSPVVFDDKQLVEFVGVPKQQELALLKELRARNITANLGKDLDAFVLAVVREMNLFGSADEGFAVKDKPECNLGAKVIKCASIGDLESLREISTKHAKVILNAQNDKGQNCLHMAVLGNFFQLVSWLIFELKFDVTKTDNDGCSPLETALSMSKSLNIVSLLRVNIR